MASRNCDGRPYLRSSKQHWHKFLMRAQLWHTSVFLKGWCEPGRHLKIVYGLVHILQAPAPWSFIIRTYGLSPRHPSHNIGNSAPSTPNLALPPPVPSFPAFDFVNIAMIKNRFGLNLPSQNLESVRGWGKFIRSFLKRFAR